jgi:hypothetical protein
MKDWIGKLVWLIKKNIFIYKIMEVKKDIESKDFWRPVPYTDLEETLLEAEGLNVKSEVLEMASKIIYQNPTLDFNQIVVEMFNQIKEKIYE